MKNNKERKVTEIEKDEFIRCTKKLLSEKGPMKMETENFIFFAPNGIITVHFKNIKGLAGYFTRDELADEENTRIILETVEREFEKKWGGNDE
jgi:hypothetical protein